MSTRNNNSRPRMSIRKRRRNKRILNRINPNLEITVELNEFTDDVIAARISNRINQTRNNLINSEKKSKVCRILFEPLDIGLPPIPEIEEELIEMEDLNSGPYYCCNTCSEVKFEKEGEFKHYKEIVADTWHCYKCINSDSDVSIDY